MPTPPKLPPQGPFNSGTTPQMSVPPMRGGMPPSPMSQPRPPMMPGGGMPPPPQQGMPLPPPGGVGGPMGQPPMPGMPPQPQGPDQTYPMLLRQALMAQLNPVS